jgi:hypothetical protein
MITLHWQPGIREAAHSGSMRDELAMADVSKNQTLVWYRDRCDSTLRPLQDNAKGVKS